MNKTNPFLHQNNFNTKLLFGREKESKKSINFIKNGKNISFVARNGMGKTTLIRSIYNKLKAEKEYKLIYFDLSEISSLEGFINEIINSVFAKQKSKFNKTKQKLESLFPESRFAIEQNKLTGKNYIYLISDSTTKQNEIIERLFNYLENLTKKVLLTIDNFDQFASFVGRNTFDLLQNNTNLQFIFLSNPKSLSTKESEFRESLIYKNAELVLLEELGFKKYNEFIIEKFAKGGRKINSKNVDYILNWSLLHTSTVQYICEKLFELNKKSIDIELVKRTILNILKEKSGYFIQYRKLVSEYQWKLLTAIAKERKAKQITSGEFIAKYKLNAPSSVKTAVISLIKKEMISKVDNVYQIEDVFFEHWLNKR